MKEIGGYFGLEVFTQKQYHKGAVAVNSGRNALCLILKQRNIKKLYIPYFLCDSVCDLCQREGCGFEYYSINPNFTPAFDLTLKEGEWLYIVNFYGQISNTQIKEYKRKYKNIIIDNVHAFFQKRVSGVDTLYSCRKFFGVADGGYVYTKDKNVSLKPYSVKDRMTHILGRIEAEKASEFYGDFKKNDKDFKTAPLMGMSEISKNILSAVDYKAVAIKRERNFEILHKSLGSVNGIKPQKVYGAYAYPFYVKNGMEIKKKLAEKSIFVATLWPNAIESGDMLAKDYSENILPLPCDQRYSAEDMKRIIKEIGEFI